MPDRGTHIARPAVVWICDRHDDKRQVVLGECCAVCGEKEPPSPWHVYRDISQR